MDGSINGKSSLRFVNSNRIISLNRSIFYCLFLAVISSLYLRSFQDINFQDIKIFGSNFITKELIIQNSSLSLPRKLIHIKTKYHEKELRENLALKNISIKRQLIPFGLEIFLQTRKPIAYAEKNIEGQVISGYIDEEGFFINKNLTNIKQDLPYEFKIIGWIKGSHKVISKIVTANKNNGDFISVYISKEGFIILEDKKLKKILLGNQPDKIDLQLKLILEMKQQLSNKKILKKIENLDLIDINNPILKVFKP